MKVLLFGATGMVGSRIATELEQRGHDVVPATRGSGADATDPGSVADHAAGADAIVSAVSARGVDFTLAEVARSLADGARRSGVKRLVVVGGAGGLEVAPGVRNVDQPSFHDEWKPEALDQIAALETLRAVEDLDWTYVSPASYIHPGERTGRYRLGGDQLLVDENGNSEISAEDYAIAIADLLEQGDHARRRVTAAW